MPISRGSIRHTIQEDAWNVTLAFLCAKRWAGRADEDEKQALIRKITAYFGMRCSVLFPYARSAFHSILNALDLPPNSEILLTPITIGPMLEVIVALGHKPVFVDLELETFCVDFDDLKRKLKTKPSCFLLTYLFGYIPNVQAVAELCNQHGTILIEDISHNIGGSSGGQMLGTIGRAAIYSASMLKYVDSYNGAFVVTNDEHLCRRLAIDTSQFNDPDPNRIRKIVSTTFLWNVCLRRWPFNLFVYPLLSLLKIVNRKKFEQLLGPKIALVLRPELPAYYREDITRLQCDMMGKMLDKLDCVIKVRQQSAAAAIKAYQEVFGRRYSCGLESNTYWQFVVPVEDLDGARDALFRLGVETGATNLMNLAAAVGIELRGANALKNRHIFIPLHKNLRDSAYRKIFETLKPYCIIAL
jgi:dTDP-4-amino-4,6-dideoxygalactose transaminase